MLEFKTYGEIDVNSTPIVVLTCGHFFTAETLDGLVEMNEVYERSGDGKYSGLRTVSTIGNHSVPRCPDCQCPIQQFATQRYNRVINRAFMNEASKKFLVNGQTKLQNLDEQIGQLELELEKLIETTHAPEISHVQVLCDMISDKSSKMEKEVQRFISTVDDKNQPIRKLHDATMKAIQAKRSVEDEVQRLTIDPLDETLCCDRRVIVGGHVARLRVHQIYLQAVLSVSRTLDLETNVNQLREVTSACSFTVKRASVFFQKCERILQMCSKEQFPKYSVQARLYYGRVVMFFRLNKYTSSLLREKKIDHFSRAKECLEEAESLCDIPFKNAGSLKIAVQETLKILNQDRYEAITEAELKSIKDAMVSGSEGMATHAGHWYNCENGHPVSRISGVKFPSISENLSLLMY